MPTLHTYIRPEIPPLLAAQIRSFGRIQWPGVNTSTTLWPASTPDSLHFLLTDGELVVSHASTRNWPVNHNNVTYQVAGLSAVFTYPDYRGHGHGQHVARAATDHIRLSSGADCAMLFCGPRVSTLYQRLGWQHLPTARITYGTPATPKTDNLILMLFLSEEGMGARPIFEHETVHVGPTTW